MASTPGVDRPEIVPLRHPWRWIGYLLIAVVVVVAAHSVATNRRFAWPVVFGYLFDPEILAGLRTTVLLTVVSMVIGFLLGVVIATMRSSRSPVFRTASSLYVWFFRGTPVLVQLVFWYNLAYLYPRLAVSVPGMGTLWSADVNSVVTPLSAAILGLGLNEAAYLAEIVRAGVLAVPRGQAEAATSLGMTGFQSFRIVVLPQAMRVIVPPTGNETIGMLKTTSLVSVIALADLLYSAQSIYARTFETIPLLITVSLWYLVLTTVLSLGQAWVERYFGRGTTPVRTTESVLGLRGRSRSRQSGGEVSP